MTSPAVGKMSIASRVATLDATITATLLITRIVESTFCGCSSRCRMRLARASPSSARLRMRMRLTEVNAVSAAAENAASNSDSSKMTMSAQSRPPKAWIVKVSPSTSGCQLLESSIQSLLPLFRAGISRFRAMLGRYPLVSSFLGVRACGGISGLGLCRAHPPDQPRRHADRETARRHIPRHHRAAAGRGAVADADGRAQQRVAADEGARADLRMVLAHPVVIHRDHAGADVRAGPDRRVADVAEVVHLHVFANGRVLHLAKVADVRAALQPRARPQPAHRPNARSGLHHRALQPRAIDLTLVA